MSLKGRIAMCVTLGLTVSAARGEDRVLLVGVNDYIDQRIRDLRGCEDDVEAMRELLIDRFGFKESQITMLLSRHATREAILDAFRRDLIGKTREGDRVVFCFSGHGSQKKCERSKAEPDGFDEVLCPTDYDPATQANAIIDDEIGALLKQLIGRNVTLIIDSCHSGTITKSIGGQTRSVETIVTEAAQSRFISSTSRDINWVPDAPAPVGPAAAAAPSAKPPASEPLVELRQRSEDLPTLSTPEADPLDDPEVDYVCISACKSNQTAEEISIEIGGKPKRRGALTWFLVAGLSDPRSSAPTNQELVDAIGDVMRNPRVGLTQTPELLTNKSVFGGQPFLNRLFDAAGTGRIVSAEKDRITINRGAQHGVLAGQFFAVLADQTRDAKEIGRAEVTHVAQFRSTCKVSGGRDIHLDLPVRPLEQLAESRPLRISVKSRAGGVDLERRLRERIGDRGSDDLKIVKSDEDVDLLIVTGKEGIDHVVKFYGRYGALRTEIKSPGLSDAIEKAIKRLHSEQTLHGLSLFKENGGDIRVRVRIEGPTKFIAYEDDNKAEPVRIIVEADQDCYLTIVSFDKDGADAFLLSHDSKGGNKLRAHEPMTIPPLSEPSFFINPPAGRDIIKVLATRENLIVDRSRGADEGEQALQGAVRAIGPRPTQQGVFEIPKDGWGVNVTVIETFPEKKANRP